MNELRQVFVEVAEIQPRKDETARQYWEWKEFINDAAGCSIDLNIDL